ncbi:Neuropeptide-Like Protein [Caenorhabditis elegans]|uniref:Neuropeptide-Like Protein n=1 Tax=Caenorhabditis elegans TaxID=6239 RepID=Q95Y40_CAEEL|nr:Neuropeptide-Like Protein [Caenorhabditis elegans]CCD73183.1 Neuropeptide-Like Protein [Caenorhabditis elegans]|eukprot:NP_500153.1 Uncharacterized protein CELE_Y76B12C.8 [Caenorhabditis elegans]
MHFQIQALIFATLLLIPTEQSVPEGVSDDKEIAEPSWKNMDDGDEAMYYVSPSLEDRHSLYRDLRSIRGRYYKSSFPYYKGLGRK